MRDKGQKHVLVHAEGGRARGFIRRLKENCLPILDELDMAVGVRVLRIGRDCHLQQFDVFPCWNGQMRVCLVLLSSYKSQVKTVMKEFSTLSEA